MTIDGTDDDPFPVAPNPDPSEPDPGNNGTPLPSARPRSAGTPVRSVGTPVDVDQQVADLIKQSVGNTVTGYSDSQSNIDQLAAEIRQLEPIIDTPEGQQQLMLALQRYLDSSGARLRLSSTDAAALSRLAHILGDKLHTAGTSLPRVIASYLPPIRNGGNVIGPIQHGMEHIPGVRDLIKGDDWTWDWYHPWDPPGKAFSWWPFSHDKHQKDD